MRFLSFCAEGGPGETFIVLQVHLVSTCLWRAINEAFMEQPCALSRKTRRLSVDLRVRISAFNETRSSSVSTCGQNTRVEPGLDAWQFQVQDCFLGFGWDLDQLPISAPKTARG